MALTDKDLQELAELEELELLEQKLAVPAESSVPQISPLASAAIGAGQGVTFDFGDELLAALRAPFSEKTYRELQQEGETLATQAAEQNPISYYTGNIGAGVAFNPLAKTVGAAAKGVGTLATKGSETVAKIAKAAPAVGRIVQMGTEGAIYGGLLGAGQASADDDLLKEIGSGAISGAVVGTALGGAIQGAKALLPSAKRFKDVNVIKTVEDIIDLKQKDLDPTAPGALEKVDNRILQEVGEFIRGSGKEGVDANSLPDLRFKLGQTLGNLRKEAIQTIPETSIKLDPLNIEAAIKYRAPTESAITWSEDLPKLQKFLKTWGVVSPKGTPLPFELSADKAGTFLSDINEVLAGKKSGYIFSGPSAKGILNKIQEDLNTQVENAIINSSKYPEYDQAKKAFRAVAVTQDALNLPKAYFNDEASFFKDKIRIAGKIKQLAKENSMSGETFQDQVKALREIVEDPGFKRLPEEVQKKTQDILSKINAFDDLSRSRELAAMAQGEAGFQESGKFGLFNSAKALLLKTVGSALEAPKAGKEALEEVITKPGVEASKKGLVNIKNAIDIDFYFDKLSGLAKQKGQTQLAQTLDFIAQQDMKKRRAMLFVLMQQPSVRKMMEEENK